jgi:hypothetical protein
VRPRVKSRLDPIEQETARVDDFEKRFGMTRGILDALARGGLVSKVKFGIGQSCPVVFSIADVERYMDRYRRSHRGKVRVKGEVDTREDQP